MPSKTHSRRRAGPSVANAPKAVQTLRERTESYVREHPLKSLGQSAAVGYALHLVPIRFLVAFSLRLAAPLLCLGTLWKACDRLEPKK